MFWERNFAILTTCYLLEVATKVSLIKAIFHIFGGFYISNDLCRPLAGEKNSGML